MTTLGLTETLLLVADQQQIRAPDADAGVSRLMEIAGGSATANAWHAAVADAVAAGLMHDPVRLPPGALQCHWRLELTTKGADAAGQLRQSAAQGQVS
jgi:hypothetical protein